MNPAETFGQSISSAFSKYYTTEVILSLLLFIVLLVIALILYENHRLNKARRELRALDMAKFDAQIEKLGLDESGAAILKEIALRSELQDPGSIIKFSHVFEDSLEKYYEHEKIGSIPDETLAQISSLRKTLGFSPLPEGIAITTTRQFRIGDKCTIQIPENDQPAHNATCQVLDTDERQWSITRPEGPEFEAGTWMHMNMIRPGDAEYAFRTQVLKDSNEELVLYHTNKLNRTQQRNWLRIAVDIPVKAIQVGKFSTDGALSGKIIDMSGGGLGMVLPDTLPDDSMLSLSFTLPGHGQITDLFVKVIRISGQFGGPPPGFVHSVAFAGEVDLVNEKIMQYIFEQQRQNLSTKHT